jgi:integrase
MNAVANVLCYKCKTLSNGEHPLMICICKDGERKYLSLKISVKEENWDFEKNRPKINCPHREYIEKVIGEQIQKYSQMIISLTAENREYTASSLIEKVSKPRTCNQTVDELFNNYINRLKIENRLGYALSVKGVYNSLIRYKGNLDFYISDIDVSWLNHYESWLYSNNISENTIGIRFRTLRVIYNFAIQEGVVKTDFYPFKQFKISRHQKQTVKRALSKKQVKLIMNYDISHACFYKQLSVDIFTFSYLMGGINITDIALLTEENINDQRLIYIRKKTKKLIILPLQQRAVAIIMKYAKKGNKYIFPILDNRERSSTQMKDRIYDVLSNLNKHLTDIGKELGFELKITTYVARHSFATVLKQSGVPISIISESLGHSSEKVTQYYLDQFNNDQVDKAMKKLL